MEKSNAFVVSGLAIGGLAGGVPGAILGGVVGAILQEAFKKCPLCGGIMKKFNNIWKCSKCGYEERN